jgi:hypothetical protein
VVRDPLIQQGSKLTGSGETGAGGFGTSVALSAEGTTALIGGEANNKSVGAASANGETGLVGRPATTRVPGRRGRLFQCERRARAGLLDDLGVTSYRVIVGMAI